MVQTMADLERPLSRGLMDRASLARIPLSGTFELPPMCNFSCRMCYIRQTAEQVRAHDRPQWTLEQWLRTAEEAREMGMLYLLITGGEPLTWPDFWPLYEALSRMGFVISVNTNGSMIDEAAAKKFAKIPPQRLNITLYGAGNDTYSRLCAASRGFDRVDRALTLLREQGVPVKLNCSLTPDNAADLETMVVYAKDRGLPFAAIPTAASCDGFCSTVAAMTWEGYKSTMTCEAPILVAADLNVIAKTPAYLTASGVGDILGKFVALADWRMAHLLTGEHFCQRIHDIMADATQRVWDNCLATREGDLAAYEAVTYGLLMSGLAMQMMGSSRPASGGEHHISHLIETEPLGLGVHSDALHGEKVGVGTVLASNEYHRLTACEDVRGHVLPYAQVDLDWLRDYFGEKLRPAAYSENEHDCLAQVAPERLTECWPEMRRIVASIPEGETVRQRLQALGAKQSLTDLGVPEEKLPELLRISPLIRNRLTLMRTRRMLDL